MRSICGTSVFPVEVQVTTSQDGETLRAAAPPPEPRSEEGVFAHFCLRALSVDGDVADNCLMVHA